MSSDRETTLREALDRICVDDWGPRGGRIVKGNAEIDDREAATFYRGYNAGIEGQFNKTREIAQQALASTPPASVPVEPSGCVWKDISTAPKDGTEILAVWLSSSVPGEWVQSVVWWDKQLESTWNDAIDDLDYRGGWKDGRTTDYGERDLELFPTHWMPLPSPPLVSEDA